MEIKTSVLNISGSIYVRIPFEMAGYFELKGGTEAKISDVSKREATLVFPE